MTSDAPTAYGPGSVSLYAAYNERYTGTWTEFSSFVRLAKRGPVEAVGTGSGTVHAIGRSQLPSLDQYLEEHRGRSGRHRAREAKSKSQSPEWRTTEQVMEKMGYSHRNSAYYLKNKVEVLKKNGILLFNRAHVEQLAADSPGC